MIKLGATLNERFTLDKELGQGGMGTVYRATDQLLGRNVAIKFLKDSGTEEDANDPEPSHPPRSDDPMMALRHSSPQRDIAEGETAPRCTRQALVATATATGTVIPAARS